MTRVEALRRLALSNPATCKRLARNSDASIELALNDPGSLEGYLRAGARLTREEIDGLLANLVTPDAEAKPATLNDIMTVQTVAAYA